MVNIREIARTMQKFAREAVIEAYYSNRLKFDLRFPPGKFRPGQVLEIPCPSEYPHLGTEIKYDIVKILSFSRVTGSYEVIIESSNHFTSGEVVSYAQSELEKLVVPVLEQSEQAHNNS